MIHPDDIKAAIKNTFSNKKVSNAELILIIHKTLNLTNDQYFELKTAYDNVSWKLYNLNEKKKRFIYKLLALIGFKIDTREFEIIKYNLEWTTTYSNNRILKKYEKEAIIRALGL